MMIRTLFRRAATPSDASIASEVDGAGREIGLMGTRFTLASGVRSDRSLRRDDSNLGLRHGSNENASAAAVTS